MGGPCYKGAANLDVRYQTFDFSTFIPIYLYIKLKKGPDPNLKNYPTVSAFPVRAPVRGSRKSQAKNQEPLFDAWPLDPTKLCLYRGFRV